MKSGCRRQVVRAKNVFTTCSLISMKFLSLMNRAWRRERSKSEHFISASTDSKHLTVVTLYIFQVALISGYIFLVMCYWNQNQNELSVSASSSYQEDSGSVLTHRQGRGCGSILRHPSCAALSISDAMTVTDSRWPRKKDLGLQLTVLISWLTFLIVIAGAFKCAKRHESAMSVWSRGKETVFKKEVIHPLFI